MPQSVTTEDNLQFCETSFFPHGMIYIAIKCNYSSWIFDFAFLNLVIDLDFQSWSGFFELMSI